MSAYVANDAVMRMHASPFRSVKDVWFTFDVEGDEIRLTWNAYWAGLIIVPCIILGCWLIAVCLVGCTHWRNKEAHMVSGNKLKGVLSLFALIVIAMIGVSIKLYFIAWDWLSARYVLANQYDAQYFKYQYVLELAHTANHSFTKAASISSDAYSSCSTSGDPNITNSLNLLMVSLSNTTNTLRDTYLTTGNSTYPNSSPFRPAFAVLENSGFWLCNPYQSIIFWAFLAVGFLLLLARRHNKTNKSRNKCFRYGILCFDKIFEWVRHLCVALMVVGLVVAVFNYSKAVFLADLCANDVNLNIKKLSREIEEYYEISPTSVCKGYVKLSAYGLVEPLELVSRVLCLQELCKQDERFDVALGNLEAAFTAVRDLSVSTAETNCVSNVSTLVNYWKANVTTMLTDFESNLGCTLGQKVPPHQIFLEDTICSSVSSAVTSYWLYLLLYVLLGMTSNLMRFMYKFHSSEGPVLSEKTYRSNFIEMKKQESEGSEGTPVPLAKGIVVEGTSLEPVPCQVASAPNSELDSTWVKGAGTLHAY